MPTVTLNNGRSFAARPGESILDQALAAGIALEYSCRTGRCGACKAPVLGGNTRLLRPESEGLSPAESAQNIVLTCCRTAESDLALDIESLDRLAGLTIRTMPARIVTLERLGTDIIRVVLKTPPTSPLRYLPGQYVDVIVGGVRRSYSLANAPRPDDLFELLIRRYPGGRLSDYWFDRARENDLLRIEGPLGTFFLREDAPATILFLATGTGIAPVKALLEEIAARSARPAGQRIRVYWGNRQTEDFCWAPTGLGVKAEVHHLLSGDEPLRDQRRGYVQEAAMMDGIDALDTVVYACGSPAMIASARALLTSGGLPSRRFFSDAFVSSDQGYAT